MINLENYMNECSMCAVSAYENQKLRVDRRTDFRHRYLWYLNWGAPVRDLLNRDYRIAKFFADVLEISYEYTDDFAQWGWYLKDAVSCFRRMKFSARLMGCFIPMKVKVVGKSVRVSVGDEVWMVYNSHQVVDFMYQIADYIAYVYADGHLKDYVQSFMGREYRWARVLNVQR